MKHGESANKGLYAGTGIGMVLFLLVGMFPGALIGGAAGLYISNLIMGGALGASPLPRAITAICMVTGVLGSAAFFVIGSSVLGWVVGSAIDISRGNAAEELEDTAQATTEQAP